MAAVPMADAEMMQSLNQQAGRLIVRFYMHPVQDEVKSAAEGRPIFEEVEFVEIRVPGDKYECRNRAVRSIDKQQWPREYAAFKANAEQPVVGTPLEQVPFLTRAQVLEFKALGLRTAENVRDMPDSHAQQFRGIHAVKRRIDSFLQFAAGNAPAEKLAQDLAERDAKIETLTRAHAELVAKFDAMAKAQKK